MMEKYMKSKIKFGVIEKIIFSLFILISIFLFISCDKDDCWVCLSGRCHKCDGKGYVNNIEVCVVCKGNGICFNCQGTGKIRQY